MTLTLAVLLIFGLFLIVIAISSDVIGAKIVLGFFGVLFTGIAMYLLGGSDGEKLAYKESLKGNNPYKMEIRYELQDSIYIPKDTVFTKIEK